MPEPVTRTLGHFANRYTLTPTDSETLPPVRLTVDSGRGGFTLQDYLTVEEAERLAAMLLLVANEIRVVEVAA